MVKELTGLLYSVAITGVAQVIFPYQANGSLIVEEGNAIGAERIGQLFPDAKCFHGRPSATTKADPNDSSKTVDALQCRQFGGNEPWSHKQGPD
jgi:K+-transporting ATPase ATPase C chain